MTLPFFRPGVARLHLKGAAGGCAPAEDRLARLDVSDARRDLQTLHFPLPLPARVAILEEGFECGRSLRAFAAHDQGWIVWAPDALVLPLGLAISLADRQRCGLELPALSVAVVVLSSVAEGPLEQSQRDDLWRAFRVPVFEQLRARDGTVIARECEVHHGLHVDTAVAEVGKRGEELLVQTAETGLAADIIHGCCECGAETPRLLNLARLQIAAAAGR